MTVVEVQAADVATSSAIEHIVRELRAQADGFIFLSGGASKMSDESRRQLRGLLDSLATLVARGIRFGVGDGGTKAGLMEAAGEVRAATSNAFPLLGVAPAPEVTTAGESGKTPVDPGHSHVVTVHDPEWPRRQAARGRDPSEGYWGSEIESMYAIFGRLSDGRPSTTIVANGGVGTLEEVRQNVRQRRPMLVVEGSGRAADAIIAVLRGASPDDEEIRRFLPAARELRAADYSALFELFPLQAGAEALAARLLDKLTPRAGGR